MFRQQNDTISSFQFETDIILSEIKLWFAYMLTESDKQYMRITSNNYHLHYLYSDQYPHLCYY